MAARADGPNFGHPFGPLQGIGFGYEIAREAGGDEIVARMLPGHAASAHVAERLGLVRAPELDGEQDGVLWIVFTLPVDTRLRRYSTTGQNCGRNSRHRADQSEVGRPSR